jgi:PAS domain S-box-containing protein
MLRIAWPPRWSLKRKAIAIAPRESETIFRLLAENARDIVTRVGPDGLWRYVSPAAQRIIGVSPEALVGLKTLDFVHPDDRPAMLERMTRLQEGQDEEQQPTFRIIRPDGIEVRIEASSQVLFDPVTGRPDGYVSILRDVTQRVVTEAGLRDSEERYRLLLESGGVTEAIYMLDVEGNVESWNAGAERIKGYTPAEIIGQNFTKFFTPEDVAGGEPAHMLAAARAKGKFTATAWRVRKDGSQFWAHVTLEPIRKVDGTLRGFVKVTQDVTGQRVEEAQRAAIIEAAPNGMMIVDEAGIIALANSQVERIFDYPAGSLLGQSVEILVPDGFRARHRDLRAAFTSGRSDQGMAPQRQFIGRKRDGSALTIEIMLNSVKTPIGGIVVASLVDVTDKVRQAAEKQEAEKRERLAAAAANAHLDRLSRRLAKARDRAERANQAKSRFLAGITHELRTPLHGIMGYAELLSLEGNLNPTQVERLEVMMASGQHLLSMINAVLDMSQIESDQLELQTNQIDLPSLVRVCLDVIRPAAEAKGLALVAAPLPPLHVVADPTRLRQVLINLLGNAVKFTPAGSVEVRLRLVEAGAWVRLEVADTGPGIRPIHRDKLFQTFERLNAEAVSGIEGAGLGLAIAARLMRLMGGRVGYADNPCGGSVFWLELPLHMVAPSMAIEAAAPSGPGTTPRLRVLIADDEALNRSIAAKFLTMAGHEVVCVDSGAAAVEAVATEDFDAVLMDVRMPGMNGMVATRRIRALPGPRGEVWVVAVTAHAFAQQIEMCRQAGMDGHVAKPFKQAVLLAALENIVPGRSRPEASGVAATKAGPEGPMFDRAMFEGVRSILPAAELAEHLQTLITRCKALMDTLCQPDMSAHVDEIAEDAHRLAGSAGAIGLLSVAAAARQFEASVNNTDAAEVSRLAGQLAAAIDASLPILRQMLPVAATVVM